MSDPVADDPGGQRGRSLDVVIPFYNEREVMPRLLTRLDEVFNEDRLRESGIEAFDVILVDDGGVDGGSAIVAEHIGAGGRASLIRLSRRFGHQCAVDAGLMHSTADMVAVMDADLQDPPEVVLGMVDVLAEGFDVVHARRTRRKEGPVVVACYWLFYRLLALLSDTEVAIDSGDFCVMRRCVVDAVCALPERLRFARGLRSWVGFRQTSFAYERQARAAGVTKYPFRKLYNLATDGIASSSVRPLKVAQLFTFALAVLLIVLSLVLAIRALGPYPNDRIEMLLLLGLFLTSLIGFMIMSSLYIMCGYIGRMYLEVKGRPPFVVMESIGQKAASPRGSVT